MTRPIGAPACFAAASVFSMDSMICKGCPHYADCSVETLNTLMAIRSIINVDDLLKRHRNAMAKAAAAQAAADAVELETAPPGNAMPPTQTKPVERKTLTLKVKFVPTPGENVTIMKMPIKPREIALRMTKAGDVEAILMALKEGRNYYADKGPAFMRVVMTMLLSGGFTKRSLRLQLQSELTWTEGTAASHVGIACALITGLKFAQEKSGDFTLIPGSGA